MVKRWICKCGVSRVTEGGILNHILTYHRNWGVKSLEEAMQRGLVAVAEEGLEEDAFMEMRRIALADKIMKMLHRDEGLRRLIIERLRAEFPGEFLGEPSD